MVTLGEAPEVYVLRINPDGTPDLTERYVNLPAPRHPYILRFNIQGASSVTRNGKFWINIPLKGEDFDRKKFREIPLNAKLGKPVDIDFTISKPGTYCYYITYDPLPEFSATKEARTEPKKTEDYYITVQPSLKINGEELPLDAINLYSILSKFMGPVSEWDPHLKYIAAKGYNVVHFTPLMQRGGSNSPFSIFDMHKFDPICFPNGEKDIAALVEKIQKEYGILPLTDVVWNHTADNSEWLQHHPEAAYNLITAPWLEPAYELDQALMEFSRGLGSNGYTNAPKTDDDLTRIMEGVKLHVYHKINFWEFYVIDVKPTQKAALEKWSSGEGVAAAKKLQGDGLLKKDTLYEKAQVVMKHGLSGADRMGERFRRKLDPEVVAGYARLVAGAPNEGSDEEEAEKAILDIINEVNLGFYKEYDIDVNVAISNITDRARWQFVDKNNAEKRDRISERHPLNDSYFVHLPINEVTKKHDPKSLHLAVNGWLWDNTSNFASWEHKSYLQRKVNGWGDCVKLRYGDKPEDSPFLWDYIAEYTRKMAKYFNAFRIDNCHSTPIHVGEYMLDVARRERPDLYTVAELFTGDAHKDVVFLQRLGLTSLVRESMATGSVHDLAALVHRNGGKPIGSFKQEFITRGVHGVGEEREIIKAVTSSRIHALVMDCTHDNQVPLKNRTARDALPTGALTLMCDSGIGSVQGFDELYPQLIELVHETRRYELPPSDIDEWKGIARVKKIMNTIHSRMGKDGYIEMHVDHRDNYITMHRVHPKTHHGFYLIAHTAFWDRGDERGYYPDIVLPRTLAHIVGCWSLEVDQTKETVEKVLKADILKGLPSTLEKIEQPKITQEGDKTRIHIPDHFPPGSICLIETSIKGLDNYELDTFVTTDVEDAMATCDLIDLNLLLYRSDAEERDDSDGKHSVYDIPGFGPLKYAGLQGWWSAARDVIRNNDLGSAFANHLREGQWALEFLAARVERLAVDHKGLKKPAKWIRQRIDRIKTLPTSLIPRYFALVVQTAYTGAVNRAVTLFPNNIREGSEFLQDLALVSIQVVGLVKSASLWPDKVVPSMGAGLPHFATSWMRCWGRDIMISLRGLLLATGRYDEAKEHILAFASVLKHGMVPNLLGAGVNPRYNARDATWFFHQAIQDYIKIVPNGESILQEKVRRRFLPNDDTWFPVEDSRAYSKESTIAEIIYESLTYHARGIEFREANAGPKIDGVMKDEGFNVSVNTDWATGLIHGGNQWNCGTWMDKNGESELAGNRGHPGTPRDGAAVEINGLLYSTLRFVADLNCQGKVEFNKVSKSNGETITFTQWADLIKANWERCYYVPIDPSEDQKYDVNPAVINRRGIYKDLYKSGKEYEDYQLRPNFPIAMTVAPDLFDPEHALKALEIADKTLRGPYGVATLDPADMNYRPYYINGQDSTDYATARGRNYHQGPEWLWPLGYLLRAFLIFDGERRIKETGSASLTLELIAERLDGCKKAIRQSQWAGLHELTQKNGEECYDSCPTQAWSAGCLIDLFHDAAKWEEEGKL